MRKIFLMVICLSVLSIRGTTLAEEQYCTAQLPIVSVRETPDEGSSILGVITKEKAAVEKARKEKIAKEKAAAQLRKDAVASVAAIGKGNWRAEQFRDKFGDATGEKYIEIETEGRFRNSAQPTWKGPYIDGYPSLRELSLSFVDLSPLFRRTIETGSIITVKKSNYTALESVTSGDDLYVTLLVSSNNKVALFMQEYHRGRSPVYFIGDDNELSMKNSKGEKLTIRSMYKWNQSGGLHLTHTDTRIIPFLKRSVGIVKFVVYDSHSSVYVFQINANGFRDALRSIK